MFTNQTGAGPSVGVYGASQEYLATGGFPSMAARQHRAFNTQSVYSRVSRTLSNQVTGTSKIMTSLRTFFSRDKSKSNKKQSGGGGGGGGDLSAFFVTPNPNAMRLQQMLALQAQLATANVLIYFL